MVQCEESRECVKVRPQHLRTLRNSTSQDAASHHCVSLSDRDLGYTAEDYKRNGNVAFANGNYMKAHRNYRLGKECATTPHAPDVYLDLVLATLKAIEAKQVPENRIADELANIEIDTARAVFLEHENAKSRYLHARVLVDLALVASKEYASASAVLSKAQKAIDVAVQLTSKDDVAVQLTLAELSHRLKDARRLARPDENDVAADPPAPPECCICLEDPVDPVILACGHSNCRSCIDHLHSHGVNDNCPQCRSPIAGPEELYIGARTQRAQYERLCSEDSTERASVVLEEIVAKLKSAVSIDPENARAWALLGQALVDQVPTQSNIEFSQANLNQFRSAAAASRRSLQLEKGDGTAQCNLGIALIAEYPTEAIEVLKEGLRTVDAANVKLQSILHMHLATALMETGHLDLAIESARHAAIISPRTAISRSALGNALGHKARLQKESGDFEGALRSLRSLLKALPDDATTFADIADIQSHLGDIDGAIENSRKSLDLNLQPPTLTQVVAFNLGRHIASKGKDPDAAIESFERGINLAPDLPDASAHGHLARLLRKKGDYKAAMRNYRRSIQINPRYSPSHQGLGLVFLAQGEPRTAIVHIRQALALNPTDLSAQANLRLAEEEAAK
jgi:tetratricopeptide (TPR) repeat protein